MGKRVRRTRRVEKVNKTKTLSPLKFALSNLLEFQVAKQTHSDTVELCCAADALDEFLKREMSTRMVSALKSRKEENAAKAAADKERNEKAAALKKKRDEEDALRKKERKEKEDKLREEWADEDEGMTDEEKRENMVERQKVLKDMREGYAKEDKARLEKEKAELAGEEEGKPKTKPVSEVDAKVIDAFSYFDRVPGYAKMLGTLPRLKIENLLLCVDEDLTLEEISELMDIPQIPKKQAQIAYKAIATAVKTVTVEEKKPEEEEKKAEES